MMYKNSSRILFSNFNLVWKTLLYFILTMLVSLGLAYATALPILNVLSKEGVFSSIKTAFSSFFTKFDFSKLFSDFAEIINHSLEVITKNASSLVIYVILFVMVILFVRKFLTGFSRLANSNCLYHSMSSNIKYGFSSSLITNLSTNIKMQFASILIELPFDILIIAISFGVLKLFEIGSVMAIVAPILAIFSFLILKSLKLTIFSGWIPAVTVFNCGVFKGLKKGCIATNRRFLKVFSTSVAISLSILFINFFFGVFTFGIGFIITIPLSFVFIDIFKMVMFFGSQGMRFYTDANNVVVPKRLEETEKLKNIKFMV